MWTETLPAEARAAVKATCGDGAELELVTDRRGCAVWKATGPVRSAAVKVGPGLEGAVIAARETAALAAMGPDGAVLARGHREGVAWLLTPWHHGPSTWEALRAVRDGSAHLAEARRRVVEVCDTVGRLHAAGWVHSDIQPAHAIHTTRGAVLIDYSWAWHPVRFGPSMMFRGGMPHLLAPELAAAVERGVRPVQVSQSAEVYTLAASLWWAITGDWPLDYAACGIDPAKLNAPALRQAIGSGRIPLRAPSSWPTVQNVLASALGHRPNGRPTATQLAALLRSS
ncbi:hypothetical protein ACFYZJ_28310 [Streptomyces sp. NPDC001848]|uniref:hypothetical protein n=1 Tax=Streptomyces sp. NPDC001848 TaxID=3364618 RepID=UPI0036A052A5